MTAQTIGALSLAHAIHYAVLAVGLVGLVALLAPRFMPVRRPADEHELRVLALAGQISAGTLGQSGGSLATPDPVEPARADVVTGTLLPLAVISCAAAAAVHAAVGPEHFRERLVFGLFFAAASIAQLGWSWVMVLRPSRRLVAIAALGNAGVLTLWLVTRTVGLPFGLLPTPEPLGTWDAAGTVWELVVVAACVQMLQRLPRTAPSGTLHLARWVDWHRGVRAWTVVSVLLLAVLSLSGTGS
ncbi:MAG: hypothetical protein JWR52_849 [Marmoricola sp.]|nr:hypothetical protein [Marmoricola sp.]